MNLYVGITDPDWFRFLRGRHADEMNFWRPRNTNEFGAIDRGELFLFKSRYPENRIVGGAFLLRHTTMRLEMAWDFFGEANGVESLDAFRKKISSIRRDQERNPEIGCTLLTQPFYLTEEDYFRGPSDWAKNIVVGKRYDARVGEGARMYEQAKMAMAGKLLPEDSHARLAAETTPRFGAEMTILPRLGQGGFRVEVMESYGRRCAISGERTLPVLEAAHIRPYSDDGPHLISNGLYLRSDLHTLFDRHYLTVTKDLRVEVSPRIRQEFSNGKDYYALHGQELKAVPKAAENRPAPEFLEWHNNLFLGE